jgi:hypothetical protein
MMEPAQQDEVVEARLATVGPVLYVMTVDKLVIGAAREAAATVPGLQCTPHGGWNGAGTTTDVERFARFVFFNFCLAAVALNSFRRFS